jgi:hypothetical protein
VFTLPGVAPLTPAGVDPNNPFATPGALQRFVLTPTNDIPYPTPDMTQKLLDQRTKPPKTTFVLADEPKDTYYVFTVIYRSEKTPENFREEVYRDVGFGPLAQSRAVVLGEFTREAQRKTYESVMELLKQEFRFEATEEQKQRLDESDRRGGEPQ